MTTAKDTEREALLVELRKEALAQDALELVTETAAAAVRAAVDRDHAIRQALETNTVRAVAAAAGLSPARVHQIGRQP